MTDTVERAILDDGSFRVITAATTSTVDGVLQAQRTHGKTAEALGELVTGVILFRQTMAPQYRVQGILRGVDGKSTVLADSHPDGSTRGLTQLARGSTELEVGPGAFLQLMRSLPNGDLNQGVVAVPESGDLSAAFMAYMQHSEQVTSVVAVGSIFDEARPMSAGGFMVQLLPEAGQDALARMIRQLEILGPIDAYLVDPRFDAKWLMAEVLRGLQYTAIETSEVGYHCWCDELRVLSSLATLGHQDLEELINAGEHLEISCDYCHKVYRVAPSQLRGLLERS